MGGRQIGGSVSPTPPEVMGLEQSEKSKPLLLPDRTCHGNSHTFLSILCPPSGGQAIMSHSPVLPPQA